MLCVVLLLRYSVLVIVSASLSVSVIVIVIDNVCLRASVIVLCVG